MRRGAAPDGAPFDPPRRVFSRRAGTYTPLRAPCIAPGDVLMQPHRREPIARPVRAALAAALGVDSERGSAARSIRFPHARMEAPATAAKKAAPSKPVKSFRLSGLSVGVFANSAEHQGRPVTYYKVSVQKVYRNGDGFKTTSNL